MRARAVVAAIMLNSPAVIGWGHCANAHQSPLLVGLYNTVIRAEIETHGLQLLKNVLPRDFAVYEKYSRIPNEFRTDCWRKLQLNCDGRAPFVRSRYFVYFSAFPFRREEVVSQSGVFEIGGGERRQDGRHSSRGLAEILDRDFDNAQMPNQPVSPTSAGKVGPGLRLPDASGFEHRSLSGFDGIQGRTQRPLNVNYSQPTNTKSPGGESSHKPLSQGILSEDIPDRKPARPVMVFAFFQFLVAGYIFVCWLVMKAANFVLRYIVPDKKQER